MAIDVWEPQKPLSIDEALLQELAEVSRSGEALNDLNETWIKDKAQLMRQEADAFGAAENVSDEVLVDVIHFFTLAEMQLPGWEAGNKNPVIYLVKVLKDRGAFDAELRKWIKANTDNRYLPYGSALA
ncbi:MAG TPA: hypothetical protein DCM54_00550 [Gammaproteobacteria bacterium]|nr:hypothetical protein [Gammaproteobacteria bacterium]|tara:strand:+ start:517 stop:900 length:384 start_codon:yes stop_codon:yes gene_type:complete